MEIVKSEVMARAHEMKRQHNITMSEALSWSWKCAKESLKKAMATRDYSKKLLTVFSGSKTVKVVPFNCFGLAIGFKNYTIEEAVKAIKEDGRFTYGIC